jgi:hypothetical protein
MISDNDLLLYYYRDGLDAVERERIATALSEQPELAVRLHRLVARLDAAVMTPDVPVPEQVQQRWQAALDQAAAGPTLASEKPRRQGYSISRWSFIAAAAAGVLLIVSLTVTLQSSRDGIVDSGSPTQIASTATDDSSAYERGLRLHLASTEVQLSNLDNASDEERARLIETITAQNRLYAIAAERANEPQLARVLRAFTPVLERLAVDRNDETSDEVAQLTFEMNVIQARLAAARSNKSDAQSLAL